MARSGRWRGPYTVKKRRQATRTPYRWAKACAISSPARLLAAYGEIGQTAGASSEKGAGVASPYTEDDEPNTTRPIPARLVASNTRTVPRTLASLEEAESPREGRTRRRAG